MLQTYVFFMLGLRFKDSAQTTASSVLLHQDSPNQSLPDGPWKLPTATSKGGDILVSCLSLRSDFHEPDPPIKDSKVDNLLSVSPITSVAPELGNGQTLEQGSQAMGAAFLSVLSNAGWPPLKACQTPLPPARAYGVRRCQVHILAGWFRGDTLGWWVKMCDRHFSELRLKRQVSVDQALANHITHVMASL